MLNLKASSNIDRASYSDKTKTLRVVFKSGGCYEYSEVPQSIVSGWLAADSVGKFFCSQIKDKYNFYKVNQLEEVV